MMMAAMNQELSPHQFATQRQSCGLELLLMHNYKRAITAISGISRPVARISSRLFTRIRISTFLFVINRWFSETGPPTRLNPTDARMRTRDGAGSAVTQYKTGQPSI